MQTQGVNPPNIARVSLGVFFFLSALNASYILKDSKNQTKEWMQDFDGIL